MACGILTTVKTQNMNSRLSLITMVAFALLIAGCGIENSEPSKEIGTSGVPAQDIATLAKAYDGMLLMTPNPVFVNPELAVLCVGATKDAVEHARVAKGPHANCSVKIFMNELASTAFNQGASYPVGAVVVKEKRMLGYRAKTGSEWQGRGSGVGGMIKRDNGYDEPNGNWEYFYFDNPSSVESGKMQSCIGCHRKAQTSDYVFADWAKQDKTNSYRY